MKIGTDTRYFFYQRGQLITIGEGQSTRTIFRASLRPLAEKSTDTTTNATLLLADENNSTLKTLGSHSSDLHAYSPYGYSSPSSSLQPLTNFNGEHLEKYFYLLGNGYRAFSPHLMRFKSPDSWSPFGAGGINSYMYCSGDPINYTDNSGHLKLWRTKTKPSNGNVVRALVGAMNTHKSISKRLISPDLAAPPGYDKAAAIESFNKLAKWHREISKNIPRNHPVDGSQPPPYSTRASDEQTTLNINLPGRDTTSPLSRTEYETQITSIFSTIKKIGLDSEGLPLKAYNTDTMFNKNSTYQRLNLDAHALDIRRAITFYYEGTKN